MVIQEDGDAFGAATSSSCCCSGVGGGGAAGAAVGTRRPRTSGGRPRRASPGAGARPPSPWPEPGGGGGTRGSPHTPRRQLQAGLWAQESLFQSSSLSLSSRPSGRHGPAIRWNRGVPGSAAPRSPCQALPRPHPTPPASLPSEGGCSSKKVPKRKGLRPRTARWPGRGRCSGPCCCGAPRRGAGPRTGGCSTPSSAPRPPRAAPPAAPWSPSAPRPCASGCAPLPPLPSPCLLEVALQARSQVLGPGPGGGGAWTVPGPALGPLTAPVPRPHPPARRRGRA